MENADEREHDGVAGPVMPSNSESSGAHGIEGQMKNFPDLSDEWCHCRTSYVVDEGNGGGHWEGECTCAAYVCDPVTGMGTWRPPTFGSPFYEDFWRAVWRMSGYGRRSTETVSAGGEGQEIWWERSPVHKSPKGILVWRTPRQEPTPLADSAYDNLNAPGSGVRLQHKKGAVARKVHFG